MNFMFEWQKQHAMRYCLILDIAQEHKIHIFEQMCNILFSYSTKNIVCELQLSG